MGKVDAIDVVDEARFVAVVGIRLAASGLG